MLFKKRHDFLHKLSRYYVDHYGFIAVENLNVDGLIKLSYHPRNIMDASWWSRFIQMLRCKAACTLADLLVRKDCIGAFKIRLANQFFCESLGISYAYAVA